MFHDLLKGLFLLRYCCNEIEPTSFCNSFHPFKMNSRCTTNSTLLKFDFLLLTKSNSNIVKLGHFHFTLKGAKIIIVFISNNNNNNNNNNKNND